MLSLDIGVRLNRSTIAATLPIIRYYAPEGFSLSGLVPRPTGDSQEFRRRRGRNSGRFLAVIRRSPACFDWLKAIESPKAAISPKERQGIGPSLRRAQRPSWLCRTLETTPPPWSFSITATAPRPFSTQGGLPGRAGPCGGRGAPGPQRDRGDGDPPLIRRAFVSLIAARVRLAPIAQGLRVG